MPTAHRLVNSLGSATPHPPPSTCHPPGPLPGLPPFGPWYGGGVKHMGGCKRTRKRTLPKICGPLQKSFSGLLSLGFLHRKNMEDRFWYSGAADSLDNFTAEFSASAPVVYKNPPPPPEMLYTTGAGEGVKVSVAIFPSSGGASNPVSENRLGGRFGPEKKYLAPPPKKNPQVSADTLPAPPPPRNTPPPPVGFSIKKRPPPSPGASDSPFPLPEQKNKKISETSTKQRHDTSKW